MSEESKKQPFGEILKGHLKFAILKALEKEQLHGYAIIKKIEELTGVWKPTTGSMYPMLSQMEKEKLVESKKATENGRRKKVYSITQKGISRLKTQQKMIEPMVKSLNTMFSKMLPAETINPEMLMEIVSKSGKIGKMLAETKQNEIMFLVLKSKGKTKKRDEEKIAKKIRELNQLFAKAIKANA